MTAGALTWVSNAGQQGSKEKEGAWERCFKRWRFPGLVAGWNQGPGWRERVSGSSIQVEGGTGAGESSQQKQHQSPPSE